MEHTDYKINRYCLIRKRRIILNGRKQLEEGEGADFAAFVSSVYKTFGSDYPKFYKMDLLSKLGTLTADFLTDSGKLLETYPPENVAVIVSNSQSSLETDARYQETIADKANYFPNPALFVYTLPNILIGELCIKFRIKGESGFFVTRQPDFHTLHTYAMNLLQETATEAIIIGWIDLDLRHAYESILYLVEHKSRSGRRKDTWSFTARSLEDLYFEKNLEE
jgi:hypothetical protein